MHPPKKILVIRNDKLGDFMLAWPAFAMLKQHYPESRITALVPDYTRPIAELCPWIDQVISDKKQGALLSDARSLAADLGREHFDVSISLFSEFRTALALWLARIPCRIGPATKLAQLFLNCKLKQRRSKSAKPEYEYNLDLVRYLLERDGRTNVEMPRPPYLRYNPDTLVASRTAFCAANNIDSHSKLIIVHPGHGGSANNLSVEQYAKLVRLINIPHSCFVITAGPGEMEIAEKLSQQLGDIPHRLHHSKQGLASFCQFIACCDAFIGGSTGPLHIAGALDLATAAFYPNRTSATSLRWQTLSSEYHRLAFSPPDGNDDMSTVDIASAARYISEHLLRKDVMS